MATADRTPEVIREEIDKLIQEYLRASDRIYASELILDWFIFVPTTGMDDEGDKISVIREIFRDEAASTFTLLGVMDYEATRFRAQIQAGEWSSDG